jgi:hypothetical protein
MSLTPRKCQVRGVGNPASMEATAESKECFRAAGECNEYCTPPCQTPEERIEGFQRAAETERRKFELVRQIYQ